MISGVDARGPFIIWAEQRCSTPHRKREIEIDTESFILVD